MEDIVKTPKTKRGEITLANIIRASEKMFGQMGYYNTKISDISREAGVGLGTIYIYFNDKYSLYKYLLLQYSHTIRLNIAHKTKDCKTRYEIEKMGIVGFLEIIREKKHMYNIIWESLYIDKTLFVDYYMSFGQRYRSSIIKGQEKGEIIDCDPDVLSFMLMGISNFIGLRYILFEETKDIEGIAEEIVRILEKGLFPSNS